MTEKLLSPLDDDGPNLPRKRLRRKTNPSNFSDPHGRDSHFPEHDSTDSFRDAPVHDSTVLNSRRTANPTDD